MITEIHADPKTALKGKPATVVVFCVPWCGDCKLFEEYDKKLSEDFKGRVEFFRMDADEYDEIAESYGVEHYPTYIFFRKGKPQRGVLSQPVLEGEIRNWLEMKLGGRA